MTEVTQENQEFFLFPQARTEIPPLIGRVDVYTREQHSLELSTTEYPVESGHTLTDQAVARRAKLRLDGLASDVLPAAGNRVTPTRAADTWNTIARLFDERAVVTVVTSLRVYHNMIVARATAPVDATTGRALRFTLDLAEVLFQETTLTRFDAATIPSGPAADRTSEVDHGDLASPVIDLPTDAQQAARRLLVASGDIAVPSGATAADVEKLIATPDQTQDDPRLEALRESVPTTAAQFASLVRVQCVPLSGAARETFRTILGGQTVRVRVWWQPMTEGWYVSISTLDQRPIVSSLRLSEGGNPMRGLVPEGFIGELVVTGLGEPGRMAWQESSKLVFLAAESLL